MSVPLKYELRREAVEQRRVFTVSQLTGDIRAALEGRFTGIWVEGEVSDFKRYGSGHAYFSLKDEEARLGAVMFRREVEQLGFDLADGQKIVAYGRVSVYPVRGQYQFYLERAEPKGLGALQLRFLQLKEKLEREGLFDPARKRPIPYLPRTIGVVTSPDGAAIRDILTVLGRRFAGVRVLLAPAQVQGAPAAGQIAQAIADLNLHGEADVLIVGRGGGSLEDLWAFNEEIVARAIFTSRIPVVSAVGHEVDFTIADFVADLRAATPSAAAELAVPLREELVTRVADLGARAFQAVAGQIALLRQEWRALENSQGLRDPLGLFEVRSQRLDELGRAASARMSARLVLEKERVGGLLGRLEALGPLATLRRGFSVTQRADGRVVTDASRLRPGERVRTRLAKGSFVSEVRETSEEEGL